MKPFHKMLLFAVSLLGAGLPGCASTPLERAREADAAQVASTLPRSVEIRVTLDEGVESLYGTKVEWQADIHRVVDALDACARIVAESLEREADLVVSVHLSRSPAAEPDVQATGAFLDFLAWSTIPLLPLWIPDVRVQPELHVQVERFLQSPEEDMELTPLPCNPDAVPTSYLDRRPFFSWPTLGAIFVPPFVFSGTDPEHVEAEIGAWVREAMAVQVAGIVRASRSEGSELLDGLAIQPGGADSAVLSFTHSPWLRRVVARVEGETVGEMDLDPAESGKAPLAPRRMTLRWKSGRGSPTHVSILAVGGRQGWSLRYTVRVPPEAAAPPAPGGGRA